MCPNPTAFCSDCGHALLSDRLSACPECGSEARTSGLLPPYAKRAALTVRVASVTIALGMIVASLLRNHASAAAFTVEAVGGVAILIPAFVFGASNLYSRIRLKSALAWASLGFSLVTFPIYMRLVLRTHYPSKLAGWTTEPLDKALPDLLGWLAIGLVLAMTAAFVGPTLAAASRTDSA